jgi:hypothetical protein
MRQGAPTTAAPPGGDTTQHEAALVYHPGECPAWRETDDLGRQQAPAPATQTAAEFAPLASLLRDTSPDTLNEVRRRVARLDRTDLIERYRRAYAYGKRLIAYVMAGELIERGIPPCFWHEVLALDDSNLAQREVLTLADLAWLRRWHPDHASAVRYQRGKILLTGSETVFHREAAFLFYQGKRPAWKVVGTLSMTLSQQWDAAYLCSTPIKKEAQATARLSRSVHQALHDDLQTTRRTAAFSEVDAQASLIRRQALWRCSRMVKDGSPTEIAARYLQLTGTPITRQAAANQLEKVRAVLRAKGDDFMI